MSTSTTLRERTRDAMRAELADIAFDVFSARGFDTATADDVARAAGVSRATFFRYFGSKEEAVLTALRFSGTDFGVLLRDIGPQQDETTWGLLTRALSHGITAATAHRDLERLRARVRMITSTTSLRAHLAEKWRLQEDRLAAALVERGLDPTTARVLTVTALACYDLTWREWAQGSDSSLPEVFADVFSRLPAATV